MVLGLILTLASQVVVLATVITVYLATRKRVGSLHTLVTQQGAALDTVLSETGLPGSDVAASMLDSGEPIPPTEE